MIIIIINYVNSPILLHILQNDASKFNHINIQGVQGIITYALES